MTTRLKMQTQRLQIKMAISFKLEPVCVDLAMGMKQPVIKNMANRDRNHVNFLFVFIILKVEIGWIRIEDITDMVKPV